MTIDPEFEFRWLGLILDFIGAGIVFIAILIAVLVGKNSEG